ncbi:hypothetical protein ACLOJK_033507 [Asimina triloba]
MELFVVVPVLDWEKTTFSTSVLGVLLFLFLIQTGVEPKVSGVPEFGTWKGAHAYASLPAELGELTASHCILFPRYSGILIRTLADATNGRGFLSVQQIIYDGLGFCVALAATAAVTIYAKRTLQNLQKEDELM